MVYLGFEPGVAVWLSQTKHGAMAAALVSYLWGGIL